MFKIIAVALFALIAMTVAKPQFVASPLAYSSPYLAGSAVVSREFHGNTSPYVAALPYASAYSAYPYASPYAAQYASPYAASTVLV